MYRLDDVYTSHLHMEMFLWHDRGKDGVKNFAEQIEDKVKRLYEAFPQQTMIHFNDMLKENTKQQNN